MKYGRTTRCNQRSQATARKHVRQKMEPCMALHHKLMDLDSYRITSMTVSYLVLPLCRVFFILTHPCSFLCKDISPSNTFVTAQRLLILELLLNIGFWTNGSLERGFPTLLLCWGGILAETCSDLSSLHTGKFNGKAKSKLIKHCLHGVQDK